MKRPLKVPLFPLAFYFIVKALFLLKLFTFLSWLFGYAEKRLEMQANVNFKIYVVTDWTYCPISQEVKAVRQCNLVYENSCSEYGEEASPSPFYKKKQNWVYLRISILKCYKVYFHCMSKWRSTKIY